MKTEKKEKTIEVLDVMIQHADKGPSGFWVDDYEGCGNPQIFPEFEDGLKRGKLVQKEHYLCPWNTAVMYGNGQGNIHTGCYHSCCINRAKYLSSEMIKSILKRFKDSLASGKYDNKDQITPLLTASEIEYIEEQEKKQKQLEEERRKASRAERTKKAAKLIQKYPEYKEMFALYYGEKIIVQTYEGNIDFNPNGYRDVVGAERFSYDDDIDVQIRSFHKTRGWFATCYHSIPLSFKGTIERKAKDNICFERIFVEGMYPDGLCFDGKEEHVWMSINGFEEYEIGDSVSFFAEVYRYVKTSNGKQIDFGLRNPEDIKRIPPYELPTDEELIEQSVNEIICETCYLSEQCNHVYCMRPQKELKQMKKQTVKMIKDGEKK